MDQRTVYCLFCFACLTGIDASFDNDWQTFVAIMNETKQDWIEQETEGNFRKVGNNYYLEREEEEFTWIDAYSECRKLHSYLATFETIDDMYTVIYGLNMQKRRGNFWVGATDVFEGDKYRWIFDGTEMTSNFLRNSAVLEGIYIRNCFLFRTMYDIQILRTDCRKRYGFLCQRNIPKGLTLAIWE